MTGDRLRGKVVVVTGAARGQGAATATALAAEGARVIAVDVAYRPGRVDGQTYQRMDVTESASWQDLANRLLGEYDAVDGLINNAGITWRARLLDLGIADLHRVLDVNVSGALLGIQHLAPLMTAGGSIVNVGSVAALTAHFPVAYTTSKWALRGLSHAAALELGPVGIRVNVVHPGYIETPMTESASAVFRAANIAETPLGRTGTVADIAPLMVYLMSDESSFVTGAEIPVDGGLTAHGGVKSISDALREPPPTSKVDDAVSGRFAGKIVLITGTAGGQGRAASQLFAAQGATVVGTDIQAEGAAETVQLVRSAGGQMTSTHPVDLTDERSVRDWVDEAAREHGGIDVLYNNAGATRFAALEEVDYAEWSFVLRNELDLVFLATKHAWRHLRARGGGAVILVGSTAGLTGSVTNARVAHTASKGAVIALTRQLAAEGAPHGIRVNCVSPGMIESPATARDLLAATHPMRDIARYIPLGRVGSVSEVAQCALFLASDDASYVTGANLVVDGGWSAVLAGPGTAQN